MTKNKESLHNWWRNCQANRRIVETEGTGQRRKQKTYLNSNDIKFSKSEEINDPRNLKDIIYSYQHTVYIQLAKSKSKQILAAPNKEQLTSEEDKL